MVVAAGKFLGCGAEEVADEEDGVAQLLRQFAIAAEAAGGGLDAGRQGRDPADSPAGSAEKFDVFHEGPVRDAPERVIQCAGDE
ncbi:MAG: hypothetical protein D6781_11555, partial [Verrucomicrobia bacterium]